jgi:hypothetical protein
LLINCEVDQSKHLSVSINKLAEIAIQRVESMPKQRRSLTLRQRETATKKILPGLSKILEVYLNLVEKHKKRDSENEYFGTGLQQPK